MRLIWVGFTGCIDKVDVLTRPHLIRTGKDQSTLPGIPIFNHLRGDEQTILIGK